MSPSKKRPRHCLFVRRVVSFPYHGKMPPERRPKKEEARVSEWQDIPGAGRWDEVTPILAGWSAERKYRVRTRAGEDFLLRITDA